MFNGRTLVKCFYQKSIGEVEMNPLLSAAAEAELFEIAACLKEAFIVSALYSTKDDFLRSFGLQKKQDVLVKSD